jgi:hypothetical protein
MASVKAISRAAAGSIRRVQQCAVTACGVPARRARTSPAMRSWLPGSAASGVPGSGSGCGACSLFDLVAGLGRAGDGAVGAAFDDARLAAKSRTRTPGSWAMRGSARVRLAGKVQFTTINMSRNSRKMLLVSGCERSVQGKVPELSRQRRLTSRGYRRSARRRPGHRHRRGHGARSAAHPAEAAGARCKPPGQISGLAAADAEPVTR